MSGTVTNTEGDTLIGAMVAIFNSDGLCDSDWTDLDGTYILEIPSEGNYRLVSNFVAYKKRFMDVQCDSDTNPKWLSVLLTPEESFGRTDGYRSKYGPIASNMSGYKVYGEIDGTVHLPGGGLVLGDVIIECQNEKGEMIRVSTDVQGSFVIDGLPYGSVSLKCSLEGLQDCNLDTVVTETSRQLTVYFNMKPDSTNPFSDRLIKHATAKKPPIDFPPLKSQPNHTEAE